MFIQFKDYDGNTICMPISSIKALEARNCNGHISFHVMLSSKWSYQVIGIEYEVIKADLAKYAEMFMPIGE